MSTLSKSQMALYAMTAGFSDPALMAEVGYAESGGNTQIINSIGCVGVLQINQPVQVKSHPTWTVSRLQNPLTNFQAGKVLWDADIKAGGDGLGPWADSKNKGNGGGWGNSTAYAKFKAGTSDSSGSTLGSIGDALSAPADAAASATASVLSLTKMVQSAAKWMSNPQSWLNVTYVVVGGTVIVGAAIALVKNSSVGKSAIQSAKKISSIAVSKGG